MRIAVVTRTLARIGGVEAYVEQSVHGLREAGHDVCVFAEDRADTGSWAERSVVGSA